MKPACGHGLYSCRVGLLQWLMARHRAKEVEREAIEQAAEEMHRAVEYEEPREGIVETVYTWIKGDA